MTRGEDVLALPICPICKDTKSVHESPLLVVRRTQHWMCSVCDTEWSAWSVKNYKTGEDLMDSLFPDRQPRPLSYMELVRQPKAWEWWK